MKFIIKVNPNAATRAKKESTVAAPIPENKPDVLPLFIVRCIQRTPTGPKGIDDKKPTTIPFTKNSISTI